VVSCSDDEVRVHNAHNAELHCEMRISGPSYDFDPLFGSGYRLFDFNSGGGCLASAFLYGTSDASHGLVWLWKFQDVSD
jgi:hypothetical protein